MTTLTPKAALREIIEAWDILKDGEYHKPDEVNTWLGEHMIPAIRKARKALGPVKRTRKGRMRR